MATTAPSAEHKQRSSQRKQLCGARYALQKLLDYRAILNKTTAAALDAEAALIKKQIEDIDKQTRAAQEACAHDWKSGDMQGSLTCYRCSTCNKWGWF